MKGLVRSLFICSCFLTIVSCKEKQEEIRWIKICYESHKETRYTPIYTGKTTIHSTRVVKVCDAYGISCSHFDADGKELCFPLDGEFRDG